MTYFYIALLAFVFAIMTLVTIPFDWVKDRFARWNTARAAARRDKRTTRFMQKAFDSAAAHLLDQGARAMAPDETDAPICAYRAKDGKRCAVGALIRDSEYNADMEGFGVSHWSVYAAVLRSLGFKETDVLQNDAQFFLAHLQRIHDGKEPRDWLHELRSTAIKYGLDDRVVRKYARKMS